MSSTAISVENLSKWYRIGLRDQLPDSLAAVLQGWLRSPLANYRQLRSLTELGSDDSAENLIWALRDVNFEIAHGEVVGIIGHNGAGKSTLLKILSRITHPSAGRAVLNGRVSSLLEVGTGFHNELTGRENVYLNGTILGMSKREVDQKFDEIIAFSGVERFIDTPVKRYSSGMKVRLAFAVAAHLEPEILLIDEVLAVGDIAFQKKCLGKMGQVAREGRTVLFVSHNMALIQKLCQRVIQFSHGRIRRSGETHTTINQYVQDLLERAEVDLSQRIDRNGSGRIRIEQLYFTDATGRQLDQVQSGQPLDIVLRFNVPTTANQVCFEISIYDLAGVAIYRCSSEQLGIDIPQLCGRGEIVCHIPRLPLPASLYHLNIAAIEDQSYADHVTAAATLQVIDGDYFGTGRTQSADAALAILDHQWRFPTLESTS